MPGMCHVIQWNEKIIIAPEYKMNVFGGNLYIL